jgi:hypothetical protein
MHYFIEKYDRGQWHTAMINRQIPDFCKVMGDPKAAWAVFMNHVKHKECPIEAGYEQTFDMEYVKEAELPDSVGFAMMGRYRTMVISTYVDEDEKVFEECLKLTFEIVSL